MGNVSINSTTRCTACLQAAVTANGNNLPTVLNGESVTVTTTTSGTMSSTIAYPNTFTFSGGGSGSLAGGAGGSSSLGVSGKPPYSISGGGSVTGRLTSQYAQATQSLRSLASMMRDALPVVKRTEPYRAYKGSFLVVDGSDYGVSLAFRGVSGGGDFGTEGYAECSYHQRGDVPVRGCHCGFWAVKEPKDIFSSANAWMLEVDLHGRVIRGSRGYRGQWQRVISITPPAWCDSCDDASPATCLTRQAETAILVTSCARCAAHRRVTPVPRPLSWLRSKLGVEVRAEFLTDEPQPHLGEMSGFRDHEDAIGTAVDRYVGRMNETLMARLLKVHSDIVRSPGLVEGRTWRKMIQTDLADRPLVLEMCVANGGLAMQLARTGPGNVTAEVIWQEQLPL